MYTIHFTRYQPVIFKSNILSYYSKTSFADQANRLTEQTSKKPAQALHQPMHPLSMLRYFLTTASFRDDERTSDHRRRQQQQQ